jgi:hypothetical protein
MQQQVHAGATHSGWSFWHTFALSATRAVSIWPARRLKSPLVSDVLLARSGSRRQESVDRTAWHFRGVVTLNGFPFTALGCAWNSRDATARVVVLSIVGVVAAITGLGVTRASALAIANLARLPLLPGHDEAEPPVVALRSDDLRTSGHGASYIPSLFPWRVWPVGAWIAVAVVRLATT